jgi:hypothetical protein
METVRFPERMMIPFPTMGRISVVSKTEAAEPIRFPERTAILAQTAMARITAEKTIPNTSLKLTAPFSGFFCFSVKMILPSVYLFFKLTRFPPVSGERNAERREMPAPLR